MIEMVWHVAETMLFTRSPVLPGLLDWVQTHFAPHLDDSFKSLCHTAYDSEHPESFSVHEHVEYWPSIYAYAVRGMTLQVTQLLALHPLSAATSAPSENAFSILTVLLESMPMVTADLSETDFQTRWKHWKAEVARSTSRNDIFVNRPAQLRALFSLLSGDASSIARASNDWAILLVGLVLYTQPSAKPHDLKPLVQSLSSLVDARARSTNDHTRVLAFSDRIGNLRETVDALVQAIFELETELILHGVLHLGNPWFSAHFLDLFSLCDPTPFEYVPSNACTFHEFAFLEYVTSLMTDRLPVRLLADYLGCCPQFGKDYLVQVIARQPIETEREACKMLSLCQTFKLQSTNAAHSLIQAVVSQRARRGRLASALAWATGNQAKQLADVLLRSVYRPLTYLDSDLARHLKLRSPLEYKREEESVAKHKRKLGMVVEALASASRTSETAVQFLRLYSQILQTYAEQDIPETLVLLGRSLGAEIAPKHFWLPILLDCTALLERLNATTSRTGTLFSSSEIYDLMHCLEESATSSSSTSSQPDPTTAFLYALPRAMQEDIMTNIRLTLTQQLSESILKGQ